MTLLLTRAVVGATAAATVAGIAVGSSPAATASASSLSASIPSGCNIRQVSYGDRGALVKAWRWRLNSRWVALNGVFDRNTLVMTKYFQSRRGLRTDGIVGPQTWRAMGS